MSERESDNPDSLGEGQSQKEKGHVDVAYRKSLYIPHRKAGDPQNKNYGFVGAPTGTDEKLLELFKGRREQQQEEAVPSLSLKGSTCPDKPFSPQTQTDPKPKSPRLHSSSTGSLKSPPGDLSTSPKRSSSGEEPVVATAPTPAAEPVRTTKLPEPEPVRKSTPTSQPQLHGNSGPGSSAGSGKAPIKKTNASSILANLMSLAAEDGEVDHQRVDAVIRGRSVAEIEAAKVLEAKEAAEKKALEMAERKAQEVAAKEERKKRQQEEARKFQEEEAIRKEKERQADLKRQQEEKEKEEELKRQQEEKEKQEALKRQQEENEREEREQLELNHKLLLEQQERERQEAKLKLQQEAELKQQQEREEREAQEKRERKEKRRQEKEAKRQQEQEELERQQQKELLEQQEREQREKQERKETRRQEKEAKRQQEELERQQAEKAEKKRLKKELKAKLEKERLEKEQQEELGRRKEAEIQKLEEQRRQEELMKKEQIEKELQLEKEMKKEQLEKELQQEKELMKQKLEKELQEQKELMKQQLEKELQEEKEMKKQQLEKELQEQKEKQELLDRQEKERLDEEKKQQQEKELIENQKRLEEIKTKEEWIRKEQILLQEKEEMLVKAQQQQKIAKLNFEKSQKSASSKKSNGSGGETTVPSLPPILIPSPEEASLLSPRDAQALKEHGETLRRYQEAQQDLEKAEKEAQMVAQAIKEANIEVAYWALQAEKATREISQIQTGQDPVAGPVGGGEPAPASVFPVPISKPSFFPVPTKRVEMPRLPALNQAYRDSDGGSGTAPSPPEIRKSGASDKHKLMRSDGERAVGLKKETGLMKGSGERELSSVSPRGEREKLGESGVWAPGRISPATSPRGHIRPPSRTTSVDAEAQTRPRRKSKEPSPRTGGPPTPDPSALRRAEEVNWEKERSRKTSGGKTSLPVTIVSAPDPQPKNERPQDPRSLMSNSSGEPIWFGPGDEDGPGEELTDEEESGQELDPTTGRRRIRKPRSGKTSGNAYRNFGIRPAAYSGTTPGSQPENVSIGDGEKSPPILLRSSEGGMSSPNRLKSKNAQGASDSSSLNSPVSLEPPGGYHSGTESEGRSSLPKALELDPTKAQILPNMKPEGTQLKPHSEGYGGSAAKDAKRQKKIEILESCGPVPTEPLPQAPLQIPQRKQEAVPSWLPPLPYTYNLTQDSSRETFFKSPSQPPLFAASNIFVVPPSISYVDPQPALSLVRDYYRDLFYGKIHFNFIGKNIARSSVQSKEEGGADTQVVSVLTRLDHNNDYWALKTTKKGSTLFTIKQNELKGSQVHAHSGSSKKLHKLQSLLLQYLGEAEPETSYYYVPSSPELTVDINKIEQQHPQNPNSIKIAFLYSNGTEKTKEDYFNNRDASPAFWKFLDSLGTKISLKGWKRYRGDIGADVDQDSYYCEWRGIEVMFHICAWMDAEQHRRLIGNDVVFVIYHDSLEPFDPTPLDTLGTVPQVFAVVQKPHEHYFRLGLFTRPNIKPYFPCLPKYHLFSPTCLKDYLFIKLYNGFSQALRCPPMNRLFEVPRAATLGNLATKYPKLDVIPKKKQFTNFDSNSTIISIHLSRATGLIARDTNTSDPYCTVSIGGQQTKSKVVKKTLAPAFNETLFFSATGIHPVYDHVSIVIHDWNLISGAEYMGQVDLPFSELCKEPMDHDKWFKVVSDYHDVQVTGSLCLKWSISGPGKDLCPACNLFLGECPRAVVEGCTYHVSCLECEFCRKDLSKEKQALRAPLDGGNFVVGKNNAHLFYCWKDFINICGNDAYEKKMAAGSGSQGPVKPKQSKQELSDRDRKLENRISGKKGTAIRK